MIDMSWESLHSSSVPASELSLAELGTNCSTSSSEALTIISASNSCVAQFFTTVGHPQGMVFIG